MRTSSSSSSSDSSSETCPFFVKDQMDLIPSKDTFAYSPRSITKLIDTRISDKNYGYICLTGISDVGVKALENQLTRKRIRHVCRFTYEPEEEALIVKFMPSRAHEVACAQFHEIFRRKLGTIPNYSRWPLTNMGATTFGGDKGRHKEADTAYRPSARVSGFPTLVLEGGYSKDMDLLMYDASWWFEHSDNVTKCVILIGVEKDPRNSLRIERWQMGKEHRCHAPRRLSSHKIDDTGVTSSSEGLLIPYYYMFEVENPNPVDIFFTNEELREYALYCFAHWNE